jgi:hypothetical protein
MDIRWVSFKDLLRKSSVDLIVKSDPSTPNVDATKAPDPKPVVPSEKVSCPHCDTKLGEASKPHPSTPHTYSSSTASSIPKSKDKITLDDIAKKFHRYPKLDKNSFNALSRSEQDEHLKHNALQHLTPDEHAVLREHVKKHSIGAVKKAELVHNLHNFSDAYDPDIFHDNVTDKIMKLFSPKLESDYKHGKMNREQLEEKFKDKPKDMPALYYGSGFDTNRDLTGKDLASFVKQQDTYGPRVAQDDPKIGPLIRGKHNQVITSGTKKKEESAAKKDLDAFEKETGVQSGKLIDMEKPYSFSELEKIAHGEGYRFNKVNNANGDIQSVSVTRDGEDEPAFTVDLKNGGKLSEVKEKLANLVNPKETDENHPVKQFAKHEEALRDIEPKLQSAQRDYDDAREKYELYNVDPQEHFFRVSKHASEAGNQIESLFEGLPKELKPQFNQVYTSFLNGVESLGLDEENESDEAELSIDNINEGVKNLKQAMTAIQGMNLPAEKRGSMASFVQQVVSMVKEAESLKKKHNVSPEEREKNLDLMFDKMKDAEDRRDGIEKEASYTRDMMSELSSHPQVKEYQELKDNIEKKKLEKQKSEQNNPEMAYQTSLDIADSEGDSIGNHADKASYDQWAKEQDEDGDDDEGDSDEQIGDFVPYNLDHTNSDKLNDASKNLLSYLNKKYSPKYVFGSKDKFSGIQRVASNIIANLVSNQVNNPQSQEQTTKGAVIARGILSSKPKDLPSVDQESWDKFSSIDPHIVAKYAVLSSSYCPHPVSPDDVYENPRGMFSQLIQSIDPSSEGEQLTPERIKKALGSKKKFESTFYELLHNVGNKIVDSEFSGGSPQRQILDKVKDLNKDVSPKKGESEHPGKLRRRLGRHVDYVYGLYNGKVPKHPGLNHDIQDEESAEKWINKVNKHFGKDTDAESEDQESDDLSPEEKQERDQDAEADKWLKENGNTKKSLVIYQSAEPKMVVRI